MFKVSRFEIGMAVAGALAALLSWPVGDLAGSIGKMLITAGAIGLLGVSLVSLIFFHKDIDDAIIKVFRNEVAFFLAFGLFAVIVMVLTF